jgi:hypothetical protein
MIESVFRCRRERSCGADFGSDFRECLSILGHEVRSSAAYQEVNLLILMVGTNDRRVYIWDVKENRQIAHYIRHKASVRCVCISALYIVFLPLL